jgi:alpha-1,6-mannosyltransferase
MNVGARLVRATLPSSLLWLGFSAGLICWAWALERASHRFGYDTQVIDMPVFGIVVLLASGGVLFLVGVGLFTQADRSPLTPQAANLALTAIILGGLIARLILCASEPVLEDDYQRYLWDGAVTASGHNPYRFAPSTIIEAGASGPLGFLSQRASTILERVGHAELTTIYPPGAQAIFALAHIISPFSLGTWRAVIIAFECATLALLLLMLKDARRSPLWVAVYWWNPVVIKELVNAAHMDGLVLPFVLAALHFAARRVNLATAALGIAVSIKLWPLVLAPFIWRPIWGHWRQLAAAAALLFGFVVIALGPQLATGLNSEAGVVAYAGTWSRNSALFPALEAAMSALLALMNIGRAFSPLVTRGVVVGAIIAITLALAIRPICSQNDLLHRSTLVIGAAVLLAPAQYPWYTVWLAPLLVFHPLAGFMLLPAVLPLYELFFYFAAREATHTFTSIVVWLIWVPVWVTLIAIDARPWFQQRAGDP